MMDTSYQLDQLSVSVSINNLMADLNESCHTTLRLGNATANWNDMVASLNDVKTRIPFVLYSQLFYSLFLSDL